MNSRLIRRSAALGATVGLLLIGTAGASPGFNAATTEFPSTPFQRPIGNGIPYDEPHVSFCVVNPDKPQCAAIEGRANPKPKQSGR